MLSHLSRSSKVHKKLRFFIVHEDITTSQNHLWRALWWHANERKNEGSRLHRFATIIIFVKFCYTLPLLKWYQTCILRFGFRARVHGHVNWVWNRIRMGLILPRQILIENAKLIFQYQRTYDDCGAMEGYSNQRQTAVEFNY